MESRPGHPPHPGEVLRREFLERYAITQSDLARHIGEPLSNLNLLIQGHRSITPRTAWLLAMALQTRAEFWMDLQRDFGLARFPPIKRIDPMPCIGLHDGAARERPSLQRPQHGHDHGGRDARPTESGSA